MTVGAIGVGVSIAPFLNRPGEAVMPAAPRADAGFVERAVNSPRIEANSGKVDAAPSPLAAAEHPPVAGFSVPLSLAVSSAMFVGDVAELVISTRTTHPIRSISFHMRVDPDVLALQEADAGDWLARSASPTPFSAEVSAGQDQIWIRSQAGESPPQVESGSVAVVRLQAMAPGDAIVTIDEVQIIDDSGASVHFSCSPPRVAVKVANPIPA
jgi:hypothetical protein